MDKQQYENKRNQLMNEAQDLINNSKATQAQEKINEVKKLDEQWEEITQAKADLKAMTNVPKPLNIFSQDNGIAIAKKDNVTSEDMWESDDYKNAWAKTLMGKALNKSESDSFKMVNEAYTHSTKNTGVVVPKSVVDGIWEMVGDLYPYFEKISKTHVPGQFTMIKEKTSSNSGWYEEDTVTEDGKEEFEEFVLNGCELSRAITVSWKLKEMAMEDFIPYIQRKMAKKIGEATAYGVTHGGGPEAGSSQKPEPVGVVTALEKESSTPQVVTYTDVPTYADILKTRAKVKSGYGAGLGVYVNSHTMWNVLANIVDTQGRPIFMTDPMTGSFKVLGHTVYEDASMKDGEILFSNPEQGYTANINKDMTILTEDHVKARTTDYVGYIIMDGNVITTKAHALLKKQ